MVFRQIAACGLSHPFLAAVVSFLTCYTDLSTGGLRVTALADLFRGLADGQHRAAWFPVPAVDRSSEVTWKEPGGSRCWLSILIPLEHEGLTWRSTELQG